MCSRREYASKDILDRLASWGCTKEEARKITAALAEQKFIDDARYLQSYIKDKLHFNKWGKIKISCMLRSMGFDENDIQNALSGIDDREYEDILSAELLKKHKAAGLKTGFDTKAKLFRYAAGKGFETEIINKLLLTMSNGQWGSEFNV